MAISQVRAQINGTWYTLTYNSSTDRYEGTITPSAISSGQSGGYFNVTLEATSSLAGTTSVNGSTFSALRLVVEDKTNPTLTVTAPTDGLVTASTSVTVSGTATDAGGIKSVTVNGTSVTVASNGTFSRSVSLSAGLNTITVIATDNAGNTTTVTRKVTRATVGPEITITSPTAGTITNKAAMTVTGTVVDTVSAVSSLTVNGTKATVSGTSFTANITLSEGSNTITVTATNSVGLSSTKTVTVTLDTSNPVITLTSPTTGQMVTSPAFTVTGTVSDTGSGVASVTVNGSAATVSGTTFSRSITLAEGTNAITAVVTDRAGNTATASGSVLLDTIPPSLTVTSPAGDLITNKPAMTVSGAASDTGSGLASVTVNGAAATVTGSTYSLPLTLAEGINSITVIATDRVGHTTTITRSVKLDTKPPVLTLISPPEGPTNNNRPSVVFHAEDEPGGSGLDMSTVEVTLDSVKQNSGISISGGNITFMPPNTLADGYHVITATIKDVAGNQRGISATYLVDTVPPEMYLILPGMHRVVDTAEVIFSGIAQDSGSGVEVIVSGSVKTTTDPTGYFTMSVPVNIGENNVTVTAVDRAGNSISENIYMIRLITDRTAEDVAEIVALREKPYTQWTAAEKQWFQNGIVKGAYTYTDLNRVGIAVGYLGEQMRQHGFSPDISPKTNWKLPDIQTSAEMERYRKNVVNIRDSHSVPSVKSLPLPSTMENLDHNGANQLEKALVESDAVFPNYSYWTSGEITCGET